MVSLSNHQWRHGEPVEPPVAGSDPVEPLPVPCGAGPNGVGLRFICDSPDLPRRPLMVSLSNHQWRHGEPVEPRVAARASVSFSSRGNPLPLTFPTADDISRLPRLFTPLYHGELAPQICPAAIREPSQCPRPNTPQTPLAPPNRPANPPKPLQSPPKPAHSTPTNRHRPTQMTRNKRK